jgi:hypothetical protein
MLHQTFMIALICANTTGLCIETHTARPYGEDIAACRMVVASVELKVARDVTVIKEYCQYEVPGPSYRLVSGPPYALKLYNEELQRRSMSR